MTVVSAPAAGSTRFGMIDGLRGIAAFLVVLFHLSEVAGLREVALVGPLFANGNFGVEVFFVISGFVIAFSVRNGDHTLGFLGRFALRRSIRLDPPYWLTIAAEVVLVYVSLRLIPAHAVTLPSTTDVLAHLVYLQGLLGITQIVDIFWTLCYEVQFYLVLVGSLVVLRSLRRRWPGIDRRSVLLVLGCASFFASVAIDVGLLPAATSGLFVDRWYQFCLGIATLAVVSGWQPLRLVVVAWIAIVGMLLLSDTSEYTYKSALTCVATSMFVVLAAARARVDGWMRSPVLQYLGRISYSLYLVHPVIGWRTVSVMKMLLPGDETMPIRWLLFAFGIAVSIVAAHVMCALVETPSLRFAARFSTSSSRSS